MILLAIGAISLSASLLVLGFITYSRKKNEEDIAEEDHASMENISKSQSTETTKLIMHMEKSPSSNTPKVGKYSWLGEQ
jgi:hypothetical protein